MSRDPKTGVLRSFKVSEMQISNEADAEEYRKKRYQSHKSTQNIIRMRDEMVASDPAVEKIIEERNKAREIARLDRIERHQELMIEAKNKHKMAV